MKKLKVFSATKLPKNKTSGGFFVLRRLNLRRGRPAKRAPKRNPFKYSLVPLIVLRTGKEQPESGYLWVGPMTKEFTLYSYFDARPADPQPVVPARGQSSSYIHLNVVIKSSVTATHSTRHSITNLVWTDEKIAQEAKEGPRKIMKYLRPTPTKRVMSYDPLLKSSMFDHAKGLLITQFFANYYFSYSGSQLPLDHLMSTAHGLSWTEEKLTSSKVEDVRAHGGHPLPLELYAYANWESHLHIVVFKYGNEYR